MEQHTQKMVKYEPGDEILASTPFVCVLGREGRGRVCDYCFSEFCSLKRCAACKCVYYCNQQCQRQAWKDHKVECIALRKVAPNIPETSVRQFCKLLVKLSHKDTWFEAEMVFGKKRCFADLMSHVDSIKKDQHRLEEFQKLWETAKVLLDEKYIPEPEVGLEIYGKMVINSYCICNDEHSPLGTGLYLGPSILDHSCVPNVHAVYKGHKLVLRAAENIDFNSAESIKVSYIDVMSPKEVRMQELSSQYYFLCSCDRCSDKVPSRVTEMSSGLTAIVKEKAKELEGKGIQQKEALQQLRQWAEAFLAQKGLPERDYARIHALDLLSNCCLRLEDYKAALPPYLEREPVYRESYGRYSPVYAVLLYSIAKLYHVTVQLEKAVEYFKKAKATLAISHGRSHPLYVHLTEAYGHCKLEIENPGKGKGVTVKLQ